MANSESGWDEAPTVSKPIHGEERPAFKPLLITVAVFAVLIVLYLLGAQYLIPAD